MAKQELKEVSKVKHWILEKYFPAWARILGQYRRLVYIDCFAGTGKYNEDEPGSPLIILRLANKLIEANKIIGINLIFIEKNKKSAEQLNNNLKNECFNNDKIHFNVNHEDARDFLNLLYQLIPPKMPAFFFIDPYGHPISLPIIKNILKREKREVFLNLMWHGINRNLDNPKTRKSIDMMFGHDDWQKEGFMKLHGEDREKQFLDYVIMEIGSKFALPFRIRFGPDDNVKGDRTKYYLIHFSNHPRAMLIMKDVMYRLGDEEGTFNYSASKQGVLFSSGPQLTELINHIKENYCGTGKKMTFEELQIETYKLPFIEKQYRQAIIELEGTNLEVKRTKSRGINRTDIILFN